MRGMPIVVQLTLSLFERVLELAPKEHQGIVKTKIASKVKCAGQI